MKKLLLILLLYLPISSFSQIYNSSIYEDKCIISLWDEYLQDCNELVNDTITQTGTVNCRLVPIKMDGKIVSYSQVPIDTVWNKCDCNDYKNYGNLVLTGMWWTSDTLTGTSGWMDCNIRTTNSYIVKNSEKTKIEYEIIRQKVCVVKKRKTSMDDFLNRWLFEKKYLKTN